MKIELYLIPEDIHGKAIKLFLDRNKMLYKEIIVNDISILQKVSQNRYFKEKISLLKIIKSSSINIIIGFNEHALNQLLEHIKKYKLKLQ